VENIDAGNSCPATSFAGVESVEAAKGTGSAAARGTGSIVVTEVVIESWLSTVLGGRSDGLTLCSFIDLKSNANYSKTKRHLQGHNTLDISHEGQSISISSRDYRYIDK
jgi:hypothetical protein